MKRSQLAVPTGAACLALLFAGCTNGSTDAEPGGSTGTASAPPSSAVGTLSAEEAAALAVIDEAYAAFNSGDLERWVAARSAGNYDPDGAGAADPEETQMFKERMDAGDQFTAIKCVSHGEGVWPNVDPRVPAAEGYSFSCEHNDGGGTYVIHWVVADGEIVAAGSD